MRVNMNDVKAFILKQKNTTYDVNSFLCGSTSIWSGGTTPTDNSYFTFTLLDDDTYSIKAADVNNIPETVVLPSTYEGKKVTVIENNAFENLKGGGNTTTVTLVIPNTITAIGDLAFWGFMSLKSVTFSKGSQLISIGDYVFDSCTSLTSITIPNGVTSIGDYAFYDCSSLSDITIPVSVASIGKKAFENCSSFTKISIPDSVTFIGEQAFVGCTSLKVYVTNIEVWASMSNLGVEAGNLYIQDENGNNITDLIIPDSVTSIGEKAFSGCNYIQSVKIGKGVISIGDGAFYGCTNIKDVYITDVEAWLNVKFVGDNSHPHHFGTLHILDENENEVVEVIIPNSVTSVGSSAFYNGANIKSVTVPDTVTSIGDYAFSHTGLKSFVFPNSIDIVTSCLSHCKDLECVIIPSSVTTIEYQAFWDCDSLKRLVIPSTVTTVGKYIFYGCEHIIDIYCEASSQPSGWNADWYQRGTSVPMGDRNWKYTYTCDTDGHSYEEIVIPPTCTEWGCTKHICSKCGQFYYDNYTKPLGGEHTSGEWIVDVEATVEAEGLRHTECTKCGTVLETETIPRIVTADSYFTFTEQTDGTYSIKAKDVSAMPNVVSIPDTYNGKAVTQIADDAFDGATTITKVVIPNSITSIGKDAFNNCNALAEVNIPNSVTTIEDYAFRNCFALPTIIIPSSVTTMGIYVFANCNALSIYCKATSQPEGWSSGDIAGTSIDWNPDNRPVTWGYTG